METIINCKGLGVLEKEFKDENGKSITYKVIVLYLNNGAVIECKVKNLQMLLDCKIINTIIKEVKEC